MCGKRCTIECSAKEPASAPRKGGGTANSGVKKPLSPLHPRTCPPGMQTSGRATAVAHYRPSRRRIQIRKHRLRGSLETHIPAKRHKQECLRSRCGERKAFL